MLTVGQCLDVVTIAAAVCNIVVVNLRYCRGAGLVPPMTECRRQVPDNGSARAGNRSGGAPVPPMHAQRPHRGQRNFNQDVSEVNLQIRAGN